MRVGLLLFCALLLSSLAGCDAARGGARPAGRPGPAAGPTQGGRFGVTGPAGEAEAGALLRELGVGWVRFPLQWGQVEPRPGEYRWNQVEAMVRSLRRGPRVMVTLMPVSPWGTVSQRKLRGRTIASPPVDMRAYRDFVSGLARRTRGAVGCWQVGNEEESPGWWTGTSAQYLELLRVTRQALREADPGAKLALGGFTSEVTTAATLSSEGESPEAIARSLGARRAPTPRQERAVRSQVSTMEAVLAGAGDLVDVVDIHLYNDYRTIPARVTWLRKRMQASGYRKPIWSTEVGGPDTANTPYSDTASAEEVVKRSVLALASGVEKVFWLNLRESRSGADVGRFGRLGLVDRGGRPKPSFRAYQTMIQELGDLPYQAALTIPGGYGFRFGEGPRTVWVLWADQGTTITSPAKGRASRLVRIDGRSEGLAGEGSRLRLTSSPIFLEAAG